MGILDPVALADLDIGYMVNVGDIMQDLSITSVSPEMTMCGWQGYNCIYKHSMNQSISFIRGLYSSL